MLGMLGEAEKKYTVETCRQAGHTKRHSGLLYPLELTKSGADHDDAIPLERGCTIQ